MNMTESENKNFNLVSLFFLTAISRNTRMSYFKLTENNTDHIIVSLKTAGA